MPTGNRAHTYGSKHQAYCEGKEKSILAKFLVAVFNGRRNSLGQDIISLQSVVYSLDILELDMA